MANIMTKRGNQDNVITYEHICDTTADMANIESLYKTLGSVCIVIKGESGGLEVYMMGSDKQWVSITEVVSGSGDSSTGLSIHVCTEEEVNNETGLPDIDEPDENTLYLVTNSEDTNNLYKEYIYVNDEWELVGSANIDVLPAVTSSDNGKALGVVSGEWTATDTFAPKASPVFTGSISLGRKANTTVGDSSIAMGSDVEASGAYSNAEGQFTKASAVSAHAEGMYTEAINANSHAEGAYTKASGKSTHALGTYNNNMTNVSSWVANTQYQIDDLVNKYGLCYICIEANADETFTSSKWKSVQWSTIEAFVVGNGKDNNNRSNALTLDWVGDLHLAKDVYVNANADGTGGSKVATEAYVTTRIPTPPSSDGTYLLQLVVSSGTPTYSWVAAPSASGVSY